MTSKTKNCLICNRIELIRQNNNPALVIELKTGYVVFGDHQFYRGYTLFLCKLHKNELYELDSDFRRQFLWEMSIVAEAIAQVFIPVKMNYELLGNTDAHLHWHLFPRHKDDADPKRPVWVLRHNIRHSKKSKLTESFVEQYKQQLADKIEHLMKLV